MTEPPERPDLPLRQAVRGLMLDSSDRVLLVQLDLSFTDWIGWVLPGGGIEPGEDPVQALRRELHEETGIEQVFVGPVVCQRRQIGPRIAQGYGGQQEQIHLVPCHDFEPKGALSAEELRAEGIRDMRWWTVDQLRSTDEIVVPEGLVGLVERVLEFGGSIEPLVIDVDEAGLPY